LNAIRASPINQNGATATIIEPCGAMLSNAVECIIIVVADRSPCEPFAAVAVAANAPGFCPQSPLE